MVQALSKHRWLVGIVLDSAIQRLSFLLELRIKRGLKLPRSLNGLRQDKGNTVRPALHSAQHVEGAQ